MNAGLKFCIGMETSNVECSGSDHTDRRLWMSQPLSQSVAVVQGRNKDARLRVSLEPMTRDQ